MSERLSVADARTAIVNGRDEDLQVNMDALLAARDADWRAAVERVRDIYPGFISDYSRGWQTALATLLRKVPHDGQ